MVELRLYYELNYLYMLAEEDGENSAQEKQFRVTRVTFHPSFSFTGFQHSIALSVKSECPLYLSLLSRRVNHEVEF